MKHHLLAALLLTLFSLPSLAQLSCDYIDPICQKARELMEDGQYSNALQGLLNAKRDEGIRNCSDAYRIDNLISNIQSVVHENAEQPAAFPGSTPLEQWIAKRLQYPIADSVSNVQGQVVVQFIVELDGHISNVALKQRVSENLDNEALRLVSLMPKWVPAAIEGVNVRSRVYVPVDFKIKTKTPPAPRATTEGPRGVIPTEAAVAAIDSSTYVAAENAARTEGSLTPPPSQTVVRTEVPTRAATPSTAPLRDRTFTINGVSFRMIAVEGGTFTMGATVDQGSDAGDYEKPAHTVTLNSYRIGETEVTQALWRAVMGSNPSYFEGDNQPAENVSWDDCQAFIDKLNAATGEQFRLPTEAEWEYAARGGNKSRRTIYAGGKKIKSVAWIDDNSDGKTHRVAKKTPNELGLYDMSGNVWEWCQDLFDEEYYTKSPSDNPCNNSNGSHHVYRGGSWGNSAWHCRVAFRSCYGPIYSCGSLGLRLAL